MRWLSAHWFPRCLLRLGLGGCGVTGAGPGVLKRIVAAAALAVVTAGCGSGSVTSHAAGGRFTVTMSAEAVHRASAAGLSLGQVVMRALGRINALLPGPATTITIGYSQNPKDLIPQLGTYGYTDPITGQVMIRFGPASQASPRQVLTLWLPRALAHEVSHSVRILSGPGFGQVLADQTISEGIATAFDQAAFPGPPDPWGAAITPVQECALWQQAQPVLNVAGLYERWMLGGHGIPHWTAFTIGYHIVHGFLRQHPHTSWPAVVADYPDTIMSGSHYQPCPH